MNIANHFDFDVSSLLLPIAAESPAGELLRYEGTYDQIMEARREDDPTLVQGVWKRELKRADWNLVNQLCLEALEKKTKDLQIAAWLLESWIHLKGFSGLRSGCQFLLEMCRTFWDSMYPPFEDPEYRLAPIHWINEKLVTQLKFIPTTNPALADNCPAYNLADWETAFHREQAKRTEQKKDDKSITLEMVQQSAYLTPRSFFEEMTEDVSDAYNSCKELEAIFDAAFGKDSCSLGQFREVLESILSLIPNLQETELEPQAIEPRNSFPQEYALEPTVARESVATPLLPPIRSRMEAYHRLAEAADYLIRTEPHSPAPYLIRRAISWGGMTLEQLLPELVANDVALRDLERLLQIETAVKSNTSRK